MLPRFVGRLTLADAVTTTNAVMGFLAVVVAPVDVELAARIMLFAAIADGLDGVLARHVGSSEAGPFLDSLADVASFGVAPAVLVYTAVVSEWGIVLPPEGPVTLRAILAVGIPALFVATAVVRLALYTAFDADADETQGVPSTLAATIIGAGVLANLTAPVLLVAVTAMFCYLMVSPIRYPDLLAQDALLMGVVHALAILVPDATQVGLVPNLVGRGFPRALLTLGIAYLLLSPWLYWRDGFPGLDGEDATAPGGNAGSGDR